MYILVETSCSPVVQLYHFLIAWIAILSMKSEVTNYIQWQRKEGKECPEQMGSKMTQKMPEETKMP